MDAEGDGLASLNSNDMTIRTKVNLLDCVIGVSIGLASLFGTGVMIYVVQIVARGHTQITLEALKHSMPGLAMAPVAYWARRRRDALQNLYDEYMNIGSDIPDKPTP